MRIVRALMVVVLFSLVISGAPIRVSLPPMFGAVPVVMGVTWGLFQEEGVEVELVPLPSQRDRMLAFQAGQIDALVTDLTGALLLLAPGAREGVIAGTVYTPDPGRAHIALITPPAFSRIRTWEELAARVRKGERVQLAVPRQSDLEFAVNELFRERGLSFPAEGYIGQDNMLVNATWTLFGMVAVGALPQPYVDYILNYEYPGKPQLVVLAEIGGASIPPEVIVFRRALVERERERVAAFFRALRRTVDRLNSSAREELVATALPVGVKMFFPGAGPEAVPPEDWARTEAAITAIVLPAFPEPEPVNPTMFERVTAWAVKKAYLRSPIPYTTATVHPPG